MEMYLHKDNDDADMDVDDPTDKKVSSEHWDVITLI
jgi:hypothetical protein